MTDNRNNENGSETMKKIDIYADREYIASTQQTRTCREATLQIQIAANTYGTLDVAGRGRIDIKGKKITARIA